MRELLQSWQLWALLSAAFAALTAIFAKLGVATIDSTLATFIRTCVILALLTAMVLATGTWRGIGAVGGPTWLFLVLSGLATGASWYCYFRALSLGDASRVAPIDKLSVVLVAIFAAIFLGERLSALHWGGVALIALGAGILAAG